MLETETELCTKEIRSIKTREIHNFFEEITNYYIPLYILEIG
jgi:hypothetical protein